MASARPELALRHTSRAALLSLLHGDTQAGGPQVQLRSLLDGRQGDDHPILVAQRHDIGSPSQGEPSLPGHIGPGQVRRFGQVVDIPYGVELRDAYIKHTEARDGKLIIPPVKAQRAIPPIHTDARGDRGTLQGNAPRWLGLVLGCCLSRAPEQGQDQYEAGKCSFHLDHGQLLSSVMEQVTTVSAPTACFTLGLYCTTSFPAPCAAKTGQGGSPLSFIGDFRMSRPAREPT